MVVWIFRIFSSILIIIHLYLILKFKHKEQEEQKGILCADNMRHNIFKGIAKVTKLQTGSNLKFEKHYVMQDCFQVDLPSHALEADKKEMKLEQVPGGAWIPPADAIS